MDTIDIQRDPCAEAVARAMTPIALEDERAGEGDELAPAPASWAPGRDRPIKYMQHPAYRRFLRSRTLAA
jgi:hypothetical protein